MKELRLSGMNAAGKTAQVDDELFEWLSQWRWNLTKKGYVRRHTHIKGVDRTIWLHRAVYEQSLLIEHLDPAVEIDHKNGDPLDNRLENLRHGTHALNMRNLVIRRRSRTGYKGVVIKDSPKDARTRPYQASISVSGTWFYIGNFETPEEAAWMYDQWALCLHGDWAKLNLLYE